VTDIVANIVTCIAIVVGGLVAIFFFVQLSPTIELRIIPEWIDKDAGQLVLTFELENKSQVRAKVKTIQIQILEYDKNPTLMLSEWLPFSSNNIHANEHPLEWQAPEHICTTTARIYPKEVVRVDRLYTISKDKIYHIGLQLQVKYKGIEKCIPRKAKQWTTTKIVCS
jgi:hypothetical protein